MRKYVALFVVAMMVLSVVATGATVGAGDEGSGIDAPATDAPFDRVVDRSDGRVANSSSGGEPAFDADDPGVERHELTLATGHSLTVLERGDERRIVTEDDFRYVTVERPEGTYVVPRNVDRSKYSTSLFNVDLLVEQGYTDDEVDGLPVVVTYDDRADVGVRSLGGFTPTATIESIDAQAGTITGDGLAAESLAGDAVEKVYLDAKHSVDLDDSAEAIGAPAARERFGVTGDGVRVAVLDTGIDADHPDFGDRVVHRTDFSGDGLGDRTGHGTHVAGIVAGAGNESDGEYVGVAPEADLLDVKVLGDGGSGTISDIALGVEHAVEQDADVISLSLGGPIQSNDPLAEAVEEAVADGVTVVVSAGNDGPGYRTVTSPGHVEGAITVGASADAGDEIAGFSSAGPTQGDHLLKPEVVAPGVGVTSTGSAGAGEAPYTTKSGTSMSAPHVSGLAALLFEAEGDLAPGTVEDRLVTTADPVPDEEGDVYRQGAGQVNATAALGTDVVVHDAVRSFGLYDEATTEEAVVAVENVGNETEELVVDTQLYNVEDDEYLDNAEVNRSTVTLEPGEVQAVELAVNTSEAFGMNAGVLTFEDEAEDEQYRSTFGFVRGLEVTVEKEFHEDNTDQSGFAIELLNAFSTDGTIDEFTFSAFIDGSDYSFVVPTSETELNFWSMGELDQQGFEPAYSVKEGVTVNESDSTVTIDETEVVPRELNTSAVPEHEPFEVLDFEANIHARLPGGGEQSFFYGTGGFVERAHYAPVEEDWLTNVSTNYLLVPEEFSGGPEFDTPYVYTLVGATHEISGPVDEFVVDPETFAEEEVEYYRTNDESYDVSAFFRVANQQHFPGLLPISTSSPVGDERTEQTWIRNAAGEYEMVFHANPTTSFRYVGTSWSPDAGGDYRTPVNVEPFVPNVDWTMEAGSMEIDAAWAADQGETRLAAYRSGNAPNGLTLSLDGEVVLAETASTGEVTVQGPVTDGTEVELDLDGHNLNATRGVRTDATYSVHYEPRTPNAPPNVESLDVVGYGPNEVVTDRLFEVEVELDAATDLRHVRGKYHHDAEGPLGEAPGWRSAKTTKVDEDTYRIQVVVPYRSGTVDLGLEATDEAGNSVTLSTLDAVEVDVPAVRPHGNATAVGGVAP